MNTEERDLLRSLRETADTGGFALACDGKNRRIAHLLEQHGWADWRGESFGSSFWSITEAGRRALEKTERGSTDDGSSHPH